MKKLFNKLPKFAGGGGGGGGVILALLVITIGFVGYYKSCNKTDMLSPVETINQYKNEMADYSSQPDENRIILAQALMKAYNENPEMLGMTLKECNKKFDGDLDVLGYDLFKINITNNVVINGKKINSNNAIFGETINNYISSSSFKNTEGKTINGILNKTNFVDDVLDKDPLIQVYFYKGSKNNEINGIVITPKSYSEKKVGTFNVVSLDGTITTISAKEPPTKNYLVVSTNERVRSMQNPKYSGILSKQGIKSNVRPIVCYSCNDNIETPENPPPTPQISYIFPTHKLIRPFGWANDGSGQVYRTNLNPQIYWSRFENMASVNNYEDWTRGEPDVFVEEIITYEKTGYSDSTLRLGPNGFAEDYWYSGGFLRLERFSQDNNSVVSLSNWNFNANPITGYIEKPYRILFFYEEDEYWSSADEEKRRQEISNVANTITTLVCFASKYDASGVVASICVGLKVITFIWSQIANWFFSSNDPIGYSVLPVNYTVGEEYNVFTTKEAAIQNVLSPKNGSNYAGFKYRIR